jgi:flagellin
MTNSINTNVAAYFAQANISVAANSSASSVARLSSGNRIVNSSDDVAALSIGTSLQTGVSTLKVALTNASQGTSLLQVADGALSQITNILQRQKAIALQSSSGSLTNTDRGFLDLEFQALSSQINDLTRSTTFNGVKLIDGSLSTTAQVTNSSTAASAGALTIGFSNAIAEGETVQINGVTLTADSSSPTAVQFAVGSSNEETVANLAAALNALAEDNSLSTAANRLAISEAKYEASGSNLIITSRTGGAVSNIFRVATSAATTSATTNGEAGFNGSYTGTSFNLFTDASSVTITSTDYIVSDVASSNATPFDVDEALKITIGGVEKTLFTFTANGGTGTGEAYTLQDLANGINTSSTDTGVTADIVYNGTSYNIRLNYNSQNGIAILDAGASYDSTTFKLVGDNLNTATTTNIATTGDNLTKSIIATDGYRNLLDTDLPTGSVATQAFDVVDTTVGAGKPFLTGNTITASVNGTSYLLHTFDANDGLDDIVSAINAKTANTGIYAVVDAANGADLNVRLYVSDPSGTAAAAGGISLSLGSNNHGSAASDATTVIANGSSAVTRASVNGLAGGADDGLGIGDVRLTGSSASGDDIITDVSQLRASSRIVVTANAEADETIVFAGKTFYFTSNTSGTAANEILIGATIAETIDNAVKTLNRYAADGHAFGNEAYVFNQVNFTRDGDALVIEGKKLGDVLNTTGGSVAIDVSGFTGSTATSADLSNAADAYGVRVDGINNSAFTGQIQGFEAEYTGTIDQANLSVTIGDFTYTAKKVDLSVAADTTIRFLSDEVDGNSGGYFDIQLQANKVLPNSVSSQSDADATAERLDTAFSSLSFVQNRAISSYNGTGSIVSNNTVTGSLNGTKLTAQLAGFENLSLSEVNILAPSGSNLDAKVTLIIGGVEFSTQQDIGSSLSANQSYKLVSAEDASQFLTFTVGDTAIDLSTNDKAAAAETALKAAFGAVSGASALSFQIGATTEDSLTVSIGSAKTDSLFGGLSLNVLTQEGAEIASAALDTALGTVTSMRATVGALQSRFNFASANVQTSVQNLDAARGSLLDTDIATESTSYAISQVKLQAGISVLAQANQQLQALLKLIG